MIVVRALIKIALLPVMVLLTIASLLTKISIEIGARVGAVIINAFLVIGIINLIGHDSGVIIGLVLLAIFFAANVQLLFDSLRDSLRRI